jgi:sporulation protein YlmC with PRC-barrel domain
MVRKHERMWLPVLPFLLLVLILAACGGDDDEQGAPGTSGTPQTMAGTATPPLNETAAPTGNETAAAPQETGTVMAQPHAEGMITEQSPGIMTDTITLEADAPATGTPGGDNTGGSGGAGATVTPGLDAAVHGVARLSSLTELELRDVNEDNPERGRLTELLVDTQGNIAYVVFNTAFLLGESNDRAAIVPWQQFQSHLNVIDEEDDRYLTYSGTAEELQNAPQVDEAMLEQQSFALDPTGGELDLPELEEGGRYILLTHFADFQVVNGDGDNLGEVEDVLIDLETGKVMYAIINVGGFLGVGEQSVAVPWERLVFDEESEQFVLDVTAETLENAPTIDFSEWRDPVESEWDVEVIEYWQSQ